MNVKNKYNECLTNLACSIRKYFGLEYHHKTLDCVDNILENKKPQNVVILLFDGMGSKILERTLNNNAFFLENKVKDITTVFPATTTAATTTVRTGLNPSEHGWLGWNTYIKPIDKIITLFRNEEKGTEHECEEFITIKNDVLVTNTIYEEINKTSDAYAIELMPFGENKYDNLDDMFNIIERETLKPGKKFIYGYDTQPDSSMHELGPDHIDVQNLIKERNDKTSEFCKRLKDTLVIIVADHGHIKVDNLYLKDYPEVERMLERDTSIEPRALALKVKDEYKDAFEDTFNKYLGKDFTLYAKDEVLKSKLFGDGIKNNNFEDAIGDYIAIAENSNKCLLDENEMAFVSHHAGYTDDEIYVPLIIVDKK